MATSNLRLVDLGERQLLDRVVLPQLPSPSSAYIPNGDDCAVIRFPHSNHLLAITTDPCPLPVAWLLGYKDYYYYGWFSIVINASDLGSMGATPLGIVLAVEAENEMLLSDFERFFAGAKDAALTFDCPILGGNLKDAPRFNVVGSAFGTCDPDNLLSRSGAKEGDVVVVIGDMGSLVSGVFAHEYKVDLEDHEIKWAESNIFRPVAKLSEGQLLAQKKLATACMDSSDGLVACFYEIARQSNVDLLIDLSKVNSNSAIDKIASAIPIDKRKLLLMWGDWQLVCTVPSSQLPALKTELGEKTSIHVVGRVTSGNGTVMLKDGQEYKRLRRIESERFSRQSYFSHGLKAILQELIDVDLFV